MTTNPDPVTGEIGAHPTGTGVGAAGAGIAGAAIGAAGGPIGAALGAIVGAVTGALAGKATAETLNPTNESAWRDNDNPSQSVAPGSTYAERRHPNPAASDHLDQALKEEWQARRSHSKLTRR